MIQQCVRYLENECLKEGQKERRVDAWTDHYLHFGSRVTFRVEGAHAYIKRYFGGKKSQGDLYSTWLNIGAAIENWIFAVSNRTSIQRDGVPNDVDKNMYQGYLGVVTWYAFRLIQKHLYAIQSPLSPCTDGLTRTM